MDFLIKGRHVNIWGVPSIGKGTEIADFVEIGGTTFLLTEIGENCKIQAFAYIPPGVHIGSNCFIGPHVCFCNDAHPKIGLETTFENTYVGDNVSIGANATILPGIKIGSNAVIGAGAIITRDIKEGETWISPKAKKLR